MESNIPNSVSDHSIPPTQALDLAVLKEWESMTGAGYPAFLSRMVQQFVQDAGQCLEQIQQGIEQDDFVTLTRVAHGLKGISGNMGVKHMAELSFELEQRGRNQSREHFEEISCQLEKLFQQAQEEFSREMAKHDTKGSRLDPLRD